MCSVVSKVQRKQFLKDGTTIGILPHIGYSQRDRQSTIAKKWLQWKEHELGITILSCLNGREQKN
jgi:hypothetical protein